MRSNLYRLIQEALNSALKPAKAQHLSVQLMCHPDSLILTIEDDGQGFDKAALSQKKGLGLQNINNRILTLDGRLNIDTSPGKGTSLLIEIPLL